MWVIIFCAPVLLQKKSSFPEKKCFRKGSCQFLSGFIDDVSSPGHEMIPPFALLETSIEFTPQKRRLEDNPFLLELQVFTCLVLGHVFLGSCHWQECIIESLQVLPPSLPKSSEDLHIHFWKPCFQTKAITTLVSLCCPLPPHSSVVRKKHTYPFQAPKKTRSPVLGLLPAATHHQAKRRPFRLDFEREEWRWGGSDLITDSHHGISSP